MESFHGEGVHIDGKFGVLSKPDVSILVVAFGGTPTSAGKSSVLLAGEGAKRVKTFRAEGKRVLSLDDLGAPLEGWLERLKAKVAAQREPKRKKELRNFAWGEPSRDATLAERISERLGFGAPPELLSSSSSWTPPARPTRPRMSSVKLRM